MTLDGLRLSLALMTIVPVRDLRPDRRAAGLAIIWAPAVGVLLGLVAAGVLVLAERVANLGPLLSAALAVAAHALLTRGLHLDGLADLADGLGSGRPAGEALRIMKSPDIGPFGVVALVFVLIIQVGALARATELGHGVLALPVAVMTGRLALTWACRAGMPPARADGLGALVAGTVRWPAVATLTAAAMIAAAAAAIVGYGATHVSLPLAVLAGPIVALALGRHAVRRLGGITGDVLGAMVEIATTVALVIMVIRPG